ncbi:LADA_0F01508g1_1 [Lachancea dasiensis]|uniref:LADA_0F01508g1_1 n=1 Tax=Lachancea dasiensis TaxID=1072105 RepID=A0A1G4JI27_9SACH|nr:LADA_0F01508g1_1 [Lachancea dasiensis]
MSFSSTRINMEHTLQVVSGYTFWSEDYQAGISSLLNVTKSDISELRRNIDLIRTLDLHTISPAVQSLKDLIARTACSGDDESLSSDLQKFQTLWLEQLHRKLDNVNHSKLERTCLAPLEALAFEYEEYFQESQESLSQNYVCYTKRLVSAKQEQQELTTRAEKLREACTKELSTLGSGELATTDIISGDKSKGSIDPSTSFPFSLDERVIFQTRDDMIKFCRKLRDLTKISKRLFPLPGLPTEYFSSTQLFEALRRLEPSIDPSLYNMERIGQTLLNSEVISPYQTVLGTRVSFTADEYYTWGNVELNVETSSSVKTQQTSAVINKFLTKLSGKPPENNKITTLEELELRRIEFAAIETQLFQSCQDLDYWRSQLEIELEKAMHHYWKLFHRKNSCLIQVNITLSSMIQDSFSLPANQVALDGNNETKRILSANHSTVGYYVPQPGVTFSKYNANGYMVGPAIFHTDLRNSQSDETGIAIVMKVLINWLEKCEPSEVLRAWSLPIDLKRSSRLRRELVTQFKAEEGDHLAALTHFLAANTQELTDVIGTLQNWLLELPDSLIPMAYYERVKTQGMQGLARAPKENLLNLRVLCEHFGWLVKHCGAKAVERIFYDRHDFPLYHLFARSRVQKPQDREVMTRAISDLFCSEGNSNKILELAAMEKEPYIARLNVAEDQPSNTSTIFVPRPLKTVSTVPSPVSSRPASKRISGIDILNRESESSAGTG